VNDDVDGASSQSAGARNHSERGESRRDKGTDRKHVQGVQFEVPKPIVWLTLQRVDMREGQVADVLGEAKAVIG
jgi:hypothetical protein